MKKLVLLLIVASLVFARVSIVKVPGDISNIGITSKAWLSSNFSDLEMYSFDFSNAKEEFYAKKLKIKAISDGKKISILLKWKDNEEDFKNFNKTHRFINKFSVRFARNYQNLKNLPRTIEGNQERKILIYNKKIVGYIFELESKRDVDYKSKSIFFKDNLKEFQRKKIFKGYYKIEKKYIFSQRKEYMPNDSKIEMLYKNGYWYGLVTIKISSLSNQKSIPISFSTFGGYGLNEAFEFFTPWILFVFSDQELEDVNIGSFEKNGGSIQNGKRLVEENCSACHRYKDVKIAPSYMAPNLSNAGGYLNKEYLKESVLNPDAYITPSYDVKLNKDFPWFNKDENENMHSTMPSYDWMDEQSINDIIAFLKSLKAKAE